MVGTRNSYAPSSYNANNKKSEKATEGISKGLIDMAAAAASFALMFVNTNNWMTEIAHIIGYAHDLSQQRMQVNAEL